MRLRPVLFCAVLAPTGPTGELTSSAQEVPEAGWKDCAAAFIPLAVGVDSGFEIRSESEPPLAGVSEGSGAAMFVDVDK